MKTTGETGWRSPSNIALVKYWGKREVQIPDNPSISMTLSNCFTETFVGYTKNNSGTIDFSFLFEGKENKSFEPKLARFFDIVLKELPGIEGLDLNIESSNSFPHSAGIASSASAISALALCVSDIHREIDPSFYPDEQTFYRKASHLSRLGSGSASRSVYGGWVEWGKSAALTGSSDHFAIPVNENLHHDFNDYYDAVLIIDSGKKQVSSSQGHQSMQINPYREARITAGNDNLIKIMEAMQQGNFNLFREITEYEAANLHAMFLTSSPPFILAKPNTLNVIDKLMDYRDLYGIDFTFTLDAGPNIHLLYPAASRDHIKKFISDELSVLLEDGRWIDDRIGDGPKKTR